MSVVNTMIDEGVIDHPSIAVDGRKKHGYRSKRGPYIVRIDKRCEHCETSRKEMEVPDEQETNL